MEKKSASEFAAVSNVPAVARATAVQVTAVVEVPFASEGLSESQVAVLRCLVQGQTLTEAAHSASVSRTTVYRWLRDTPIFGEAYQSVQRQLRDFVQGDLQSLMLDAMHNVRSAVLRGDERMSMMLLKNLGLFAARTSPEPVV